MRAIYATQFDLGDASVEEALAVVARWFAYEEPDAELATSIALGQRTYELPQERGSLDVEVLEVENSRMWTGTWRHPHADDPSLALISEATLAEIDGLVSFGLAIQVERTGDELSPVRFQFHAPRLPRDLIDRFQVWDGETALRSEPVPLGHADVDRFVERVLCDPTRQRPVVFISSDERGARPAISPVDVARDLCGLAHVYHSLYSLPDRALSRRLGPLGCYGGAVRIYWPGFSTESDRYTHDLYTPARLRNWQGKPFREALRDRLFAIAASTMAAPSMFRELRRAARRRQLQAQDVPDEWLVELEQIEEERDRWKKEAGRLEGELVQANEEAGRLRASFRQVAEGVATPVEALEHVDEETQPPKTVREAVERAEGLCPHLVFVEAAFESAEDSPFQDPPVVLEALLKLEELAAREAQPGGIGKGLNDAAFELGLQWRGGISQTAATRYERHYTAFR